MCTGVQALKAGYKRGSVQHGLSWSMLHEQCKTHACNLICSADAVSCGSVQAECVLDHGVAQQKELKELGHQLTLPYDPMPRSQSSPLASLQISISSSSMMEA